MSKQSLHQVTPARRISRLQAALESQAEKLSPEPIIERLRRLVETLQVIAGTPPAEDDSTPFDGRPMYGPEVTSRDEVL